jgi:hypothetical protein
MISFLFLMIAITVNSARIQLEVLTIQIAVETVENKVNKDNLGKEVIS